MESCGVAKDHAAGTSTEAVIELSSGSDSDSAESDEETEYNTEQEDELDRLDAKADEMEAARACKRRRMA